MTIAAVTVGDKALRGILQLACYSPWFHSCSCREQLPAGRNTGGMESFSTSFLGITGTTVFWGLATKHPSVSREGFALGGDSELFWLFLSAQALNEKGKNATAIQCLELCTDGGYCSNTEEHLMGEAPRCSSPNLSQKEAA